MQSFEKFFVILGSCEPCSQSRHISCLFCMDFFFKEWADTKAHNLKFFESSPTLDLTSTLMVGRALTRLNWDSAWPPWLSSPRFLSKAYLAAFSSRYLCPFHSPDVSVSGVTNSLTLTLTAGERLVGRNSGCWSK